MAGGLMNLVSQGQENIVLNGNPQLSFFKKSYKKYTNFGKQNFRLDYDGTSSLNLTTSSTFSFKVLRYGDLLMDTYISITLPTIWSPIYPPQEVLQPDGSTIYTDWSPYEFQWIENLGAQIIENISITCGNQKLQEYSGRYILASIQRDYSGEKRALFDEMIGNVPEMYDPALYNTQVSQLDPSTKSQNYPNAYYTDNPAGAQPSIVGRTLYIPLGAWFNLKSVNAFPLTCLQYNILQINVTFRPINEWFTIRDVQNYVENFPVIAPNFNQFYMQFYRFLQTPPDISLGPTSYTDTRVLWNADINLNCTYAFLSNDEQRAFALNEQTYLMRTIYERPYYNVTGANKIDLDSLGMVISWMFYFQRSDVNLRNQWSNYTNWDFANKLPFPSIPAPTSGDYPNPDPSGPATLGPGTEADGTPSGLYTSGIYNPQNLKDILIALGILLDGTYRENILPVQVFNYTQKYTTTGGNAPSGLYCYNFCIETTPYSNQPSGAMNMSRFTNIQFEFTTITPPVDPYAQTLSICDPNTGDIVGINKPTWRIYKYNYDLYVIEERMNQVIFSNGNCGLLYAL
jgi:hypothetical protein